MLIHAAVAPGAVAAAAGLGTMKTPMVLATPFPPTFQPGALVAAAEAGAPAQAAVAAFVMPPPLQPAAPMALAMVEAPAQALAAKVLAMALVVTDGIPPPTYILVWEDRQPLPLVVHFDGCPSHLAHFLAQV